MGGGEHLLEVLWRRRLTAIATFVLVLGAAAAVTFTMDKSYSTTAYLYVSSAGQAASNFEQVQVSQVVTRSYAELLQTRNVADRVARRLPFDIDGEALQDRVDVSAVADSQLITIAASGRSPQQAQATANTYARTFIDTSGDLLAAGGGENEIVLAAPAPSIDTPTSPRPKLYLLVGALVAAFAAFGAALLRHRLDSRLAVESSTTSLHGVPLIGRISSIAPGEVRAVPAGARTRDRRLMDEQFRLLLANLAFVNEGRRPRTLAVVSAGQAEGKSTTAVNLAVVGAELGLHTLLVDGDMRRPSLAKLLEVEEPDERGLSTLLGNISPASLPDTAIDIFGVPKLALLTSGPIPADPAVLLGGAALEQLVARAAEHYDLVIVDTPPLTVADASLICARVEGVILVVNGRTTKRTAVLRSLDQLARVGAQLLGVVLNRADVDETSYYYGPDDNRPAQRRTAARSRSRPGAAGER